MNTKLPALACAFSLLFAACGSSVENADSDVSTEDVASLEDNEVASLTDAADAQELEDPDAPETDPEQAALAFSQCMRDEGLDFPDVGVDAEGNVNLREAFEGLDRGDDVQAAREACQTELEAGGFGGGRRDEGDQTEIEDGLVSYSACIRDEGFDVGDITLGGGQGQQQDDGENVQNEQAGEGEGEGGGEGRGQAGEREGGFGDRQGRIVNQLGLDAEDPDVQAALTKCEPILEETFADFGAGQE